MGGINKNTVKITFPQIIAVVIAIAPILNIYKFGPINASAGDVCLLLLLAACIIKITGLHLNFNTSNIVFIPFLVYAFLESTFIIMTQLSANYSDYINKWIKLITYYLVINSINIVGFDKKLAKHIIINIATAISVLLVIQWLALCLLNITIFPYLSYPTLHYNLNLEELRTQTERWIDFGIWRPSAIFAEPAAYAEYCILVLTFSVFSPHDKTFGTWIKRGILLTGIILAESATGIILLMCVIGVWFFSHLKRKIPRWMGWILTFTIPVTCIFLQSDFFINALSRIRTFDFSGGRTTANLRVLQGFHIYSQLPTIYKIFGLGFGNVKNYLISHSITTPYLSDIGNEAMSSITTILNSSGIIGLFFYLMSFINIWRKKSDSVKKVFMILLSMLMCTSGLFFTSFFVTYFVFICTKSKTSN